MPEFIDLTGKRFGRLTVSERSLFSGNSKKPITYWECNCDCGNKTVVQGGALRRGVTQSCGCLQKEWTKENKPRTTHGSANSRLYQVWSLMKQRCELPSNNRYYAYGALGVRVCPEWHDFITFQKWAYENGYDPGSPRGACTIDRIDPEGNYCPENCRWVSMKIQNSNKRKTGDNKCKSQAEKSPGR